MSRRACRLAGILAAFGALLLTVALSLPSLASAQKGAAQPPQGYAGTESCKGCHEEAFKKFEGTRMGRLFVKQPRNTKESLACESCHGPGKAHVDAGGGKNLGGMVTFSKTDKTPVARQNEMCTQCHATGPHAFWAGSAHEAADVKCTSCHTVMHDVSPRGALSKATIDETCGTCHLKQKAQQYRLSHHPSRPAQSASMREGTMSCTSCHNPHGTTTNALLKAASVNDTCYTCHTQYRGPFLYEHAPVTESCSNCHDPHGSNHEKMLKISGPRICQQCHVPSRHPTRPYGDERATNQKGNFKYVMGRPCLGCHVNVHGSNHPSGFGLVR